MAANLGSAKVSVFRVLFAYFDESMASKLVYKPYRSWNTVGLTPI